MFEHAFVLELENVVLQAELQQLVVERGRGAELGGINGLQPGQEDVETFDLGVECRTTRVHELAVVLVQPEAHGVERLELEIVDEDLVGELGEGNFERRRIVRPQGQRGGNGQDGGQQGGTEQIFHGAAFRRAKRSLSM